MADKKSRLDARKARIQALREKKAREKRDTPFWGERHSKEDWPLAIVNIWYSSCGAYRVVRMESKFGPSEIRFGCEIRKEGHWDLLSKDKSRPGNYAQYFSCLSDALSEVEQQHLIRTRKVIQSSNLERVVDIAGDLAMSIFSEKIQNRHVQNECTTDKVMDNELPKQRFVRRSELQITRENAKSLLERVGFEAVGKWNNGRITEVINELVSLVDSPNFTPPLMGEPDYIIYKKVLRANKKHEEIALTKEVNKTDPSSNGVHGKVKEKKTPPKGTTRKTSPEASVSSNGESPKVDTPKVVTKTVKTAKGKGKDKDNKGGRGRVLYRIFGYSASSVIRWMGNHGWEYYQARYVTKKYNANMCDLAVRVNVTDGKEGSFKYGPMATLTREQERELNRCKKEAPLPTRAPYGSKVKEKVVETVSKPEPVKAKTPAKGKGDKGVKKATKTTKGKKRLVKVR